jgi:hypothetical protein
MRRFNYLCLFLAGGWLLLQVHAVQASTLYLYNVDFDQYGNGTYVEYSPAVVDPGNVIATGTLPEVSGGANAGLTYQLPYTITYNAEVSNQWEGIYGVNGTTPSDLINFQENGLFTVYSNNADGTGGGLALVDSTVWTAADANWDGNNTKQNANLTPAYWSTNGDGGGVPGDPAPHPNVEANYYFTTVVPEPTSLTLALASLATGMLLMWRRRGA